jgi:putative ABC transport system permease protein
MDFLWRLLALVSALALILSLATIYSMTSLIVSRRTREIGIRIALGADARRIVAAMFSRPLTQVCAGVLLGGALVFVFTRVVAGLSLREVVGIAAYVVVMTGVCMLGCLVPTRRALRVEPTEALRIE